MSKAKKEENANPTFHQRLIAAKQSFGSIKKDGINPHFKSNYVTLEGLVSAINPALHENGLAFFHSFESDAIKCVVTDGETDISTSLPIPTETNIQKLGSAVTYARRYTLSMLLGLVAETDDDGQEGAGAGNVRAKPAPKPKANWDYSIQTEGRGHQGKTLAEISKEDPCWLMDHFKKPQSKAKLVDADREAIKAAVSTCESRLFSACEKFKADKEAIQVTPTDGPPEIMATNENGVIPDWVEEA